MSCVHVVIFFKSPRLFRSTSSKAEDKNEVEILKVFLELDGRFVCRI